MAEVSWVVFGRQFIRRPPVSLPHAGRYGPAGVPEILLRYFVEPSRRHNCILFGMIVVTAGQGFIDATSIKLAGKSTGYAGAGDRHLRSSMGCLMTSSTARLNSGNSSRNKTPLCASEISPAGAARHRRPAPHQKWYDAATGRDDARPGWHSSGSLPATEWILVVSSDSANSAVAKSSAAF